MNKISYVDFHTHRIPSSSDVIGIVSIFHDSPLPDYPFYSVGVHPWFVPPSPDTPEGLRHWNRLVEKVPSALAIGECGLDKAPRRRENFSLQKQWFLHQIRLSEELQKPLIIHCVRCFNELMSLRKGTVMPWIVHGYRKSLDLARTLTEDFGMILSFGDALLHSERVREVYRQLPLEKTVLETDESPVPVADIYRVAAQLKRITPERLGEKMLNQFRVVFKKSVF